MSSTLAKGALRKIKRIARRSFLEPICYVFTWTHFRLFRRWSAPSEAPLPRENVARVLVVNLDFIGDALWVTPLVRALRRARPQAHLALLASPISAQVFARNSHLDEVIVCEPGMGGLGVFSQLARSLARRRFDVAIIAEQNPELAGWARRLTYFARIPHRLGAAYGSYQFLLAQALPRNDPVQGEYWPRYHLRLLEPLGIVSEDVGLEMHLAEEDLAFVQQLLRDRDLKDDSLRVVLHPGAARYASTNVTKQWPPLRFAELADRLVNQWGAEILLTGVPSEQEVIEDVLQRMRRRAHNLCGQLSVGQLAALLGQADLVVTNDTAPLHIAAAMGTPTVAVFGPTNPKLLAPPNGQCCFVWKGLPCSPCLRYRDKPPYWPRCPFPQRECLEQVTVDEVFRAAEVLLGEALTAKLYYG